MLEDKFSNSVEYFDIDDIQNLILPWDFHEDIDLYSWEFLSLVNKVNKLPHFNDEIFNVVDLDNTIYSRTPTLQMSKLNENRWEAGNKVIVEELWWYQEFCRKYYKKNQAVKDFVDLLKQKNSLILTAWQTDFQNIKLDSIWYWIEKVEKVIVKRDHEKPLKLLMYIIYRLWYIPGTINVYDDRVNFFNKFAPLLSKLLKTNININEVKLSEQKTNEIQSIDQIKYSRLSK